MSENQVYKFIPLVGIVLIAVAGLLDLCFGVLSPVCPLIFISTLAASGVTLTFWMRSPQVPAFLVVAFAWAILGIWGPQIGDSPRATRLDHYLPALATLAAVGQMYALYVLEKRRQSKLAKPSVVK